jgi:hypothetical protein
MLEQPMPVYVDVVKKAADPEVFRQIVRELLDLPYGNWTTWEEDIWLPAMLRYPKGYLYSETEREKLDQLCWLVEPMYGHDGMSVAQMIAACTRYCVDLSEDDSDFVVGLSERGATFVRRRELRRLTRLCTESGVDMRAA